MTAETDARIARLLHHRKAGLALGDPVVPPISLATTFHPPANHRPRSAIFDRSSANGYVADVGATGRPETGHTTGGLAISSAAPCLPRHASGSRTVIRRASAPIATSSTSA